MDRQWLEERLSAFPLYAYAFITTDELVFEDRVRAICERECPMYNTTWACPPAVGSVEECRERILSFTEGLIIATIAEVGDIADIAGASPSREGHEQVTRQILQMVRERADETLALSAEACAHCKACTYPDAPCRFPERMLPCVESHGILVTALAEKCGIDFLAGANLIVWFSLILYK